MDELHVRHPAGAVRVLREFLRDSGPELEGREGSQVLELAPAAGRAQVDGPEFSLQACKLRAQAREVLAGRRVMQARVADLFRKQVAKDVEGRLGRKSV